MQTVRIGHCILCDRGVGSNPTAASTFLHVVVVTDFATSLFRVSILLAATETAC